MNAFTKVSEKGQVVVPKAMRDRLGWAPGTSLEVIDTADGVILRPRRMAVERISVEEAVKRMREIYQHKGPPIPIERLSWSSDMTDDE